MTVLVLRVWRYLFDFVARFGQSKLGTAVGTWATLNPCARRGALATRNMLLTESGDFFFFFVEDHAQDDMLCQNQEINKNKYCNTML